MAKTGSKKRRTLFSDDSQYVVVFFGGMLALWLSSWVASLIPANLFSAQVDVLNLVTLIITLALYLAVMIPFSRIISLGGLRATGSMTVIASMVSGLFAFVFLSTIGQIYNDSSFKPGDAAVVKLAVAGIFGIFYAVGWWCGVHYDTLVSRRRAR
jgi:hypothetical protein